MSKTKVDFKVGRVKYRVEADVHSWQLSKWAEKRWKVVGWYVTIGAVAGQIYDLGLRGAGASTFDELADAGRQIRKELEAVFCGPMLADLEK